MAKTLPTKRQTTTLGKTPKATRITSRKKPSGMPRRPLNAYNFFFREQRAQIKEEMTDQQHKLSGSEIFSALGKEVATRWKNLGQEDREQYVALAQGDQKRYSDEMAVYNRMVYEKMNQSNQDRCAEVEAAQQTAEGADEPHGAYGMSAPSNSCADQNTGTAGLQVASIPEVAGSTSIEPHAAEQKTRLAKMFDSDASSSSVSAGAEEACLLPSSPSNAAYHNGNINSSALAAATSTHGQMVSQDYMDPFTGVLHSLTQLKHCRYPAPSLVASTAAEAAMIGQALSSAPWQPGNQQQLQQLWGQHSNENNDAARVLATQQVPLSPDAQQRVNLMMSNLFRHQEQQQPSIDPALLLAMFQSQHTA